MTLEEHAEAVRRAVAQLREAEGRQEIAERAASQARQMTSDAEHALRDAKRHLLGSLGALHWNIPVAVATVNDT